MNRSTTLLAASLALALAACNGDRNDDAPSGETGAFSSATDQPSGGHPTSTDPSGTAGHAGMDMATDATADAARGAMGADGSAMADGDRKALMSVMEVDRHEIAAAESALAKGVSGETRRYAETLRDDHTRNLEATSRLLGGAAAGATGSSMGSTAGSGATAGTTGTAGTGTDALPADPQVAAMTRKHESERKRLDALEGDAFESAWIEAMAAGHAEALEMLDSQLLPGAGDGRVRSHLQSTREAIARHLETARSLQGGDASARTAGNQ